jgi:phosphosulfolactate synthase (CoM biosynthesis protein A)
MTDRPFDFVPMNARPAKPRTLGITEIRGPYYAPAGPRYLADLFELAGDSIDGLKYAGGSFALLPRSVLLAINDLAHRHGAYVSTGGWIEHVLLRGGAAIVDRYLQTCKEVGFDVVEISRGFISLGGDDMARLVERVVALGLKAKAEVGIQIGAGGASRAADLAAAGTRDVESVIAEAKRCLDAGAFLIMLESEGITENVEDWRTEAIARVANAVGLERVMFEAADPAVFGWYVKQYGPGVNLFVDHAQVIELECLRAGIWGTKDLWNRVVTFP